MPIVGAFDVHRRQLTFHYLDTDPASEGVPHQRGYSRP